MGIRKTKGTAMSNLFTDIDEALNQIRHGWCSVEKAHLLASIIVATRPDVVLEVGIWAGRSLVPMAMAVHHVKNGKVVGIDPWSKDAATAGLDGANLQWWSTVPYEDIYNQFTSALKKFGVSQVVEIHRNNSDDVESPEEIGLAHLDGNHSEQAVKDVIRFCPQVKRGGFCFMDDVTWTGGGVTSAVLELEKLGFTKLFDMDTGGLFQRI